MKLTPELAQRLKARTAQLILTEGQFNMETFTGASCARHYPTCGTACCIGGNLYIAGRELGLVEDDPYPVHGRAVSVKEAAGALWDELHPGVDSDFYAHGLGLDEVSPEMAVAHLMTGGGLFEFAVRVGPSEYRPTEEALKHTERAREFIKEVLG